MRSDASLILDEPCPCDTCASIVVCRFTGSACKAFSMYVDGEVWEGVARNPTLKQGKALGLKAADMSDADRQRLLAGIMME